MLKSSILRLICHTLILSFSFIHTIDANGVTAEPQNAPWITTPDWGPIESITLTNHVSRELQIDAIRFNSPNTGGSISKNEGFDKAFSIDDGNGSDRFQLQLNTNSVGTGLENVLLSSDSRTFKMTCANTNDGDDWTPHSFQYMVKLGSLAEQKVNKDIQGITLIELDSIHKLDMFYDKDLYVLDTLGIHGSDWGAGFIDTWFDQEKELPFWQIQTCDVPVEDLTSPPELDTFRFWNEYKAFLPDSLDINDANYGATKRPFYMMGLAMAQEYMNIDMQTLMAKGFQESNAGLSMYEGQTAQDTIFDTVVVKDGEEYPNGQTINGWSPWGTHSGPDTTIIYIEVKSVQKLFFKYVKYTNRTENGGTSMGPMHYEEATYKDKIFDAYPKFFPHEGGTYQNSSKFIDAPTGGSPLNSPAIVNAYLISSLYMWYCWQLVVADLGEEAIDKMKNHPNRRIMSDAISYAWNAGSDGDFRNRFEAGTFDDFLYVKQINGGIEFLEHANRKSELIGGNRKVYDSPIDKGTLEEFFFGEGGNGSSGILGKNGLLHHFKLDASKRQELWSEVDSAYNMLKGKSPSTTGTDKVSFRYDYLAILRIAKKFLDLSIPLPKTVIFKNWVQKGTEPDPNAKSADKTYPYLVLNSKQKVGNTIQVKTSVKDNRFLNIDSAAVVEWTMDPDWVAKNWFGAIKESGADTLKADYTVNIDQQYVNNTLPSGKDTGIVWIRVSDANFNSTIDTIHVIRDENIIVLDPPTFDSSNAIDNNGDGMADEIELHLTQASGGEQLSNYSNMKYSWPTATNLLAPSQVSGSTSPLSITDPGNLTGGSGTGKIEFSYNTTNFSEAINDRVGPAILSGEAKLTLGASSSDNDTLTVTFSEDVTSLNSSDLILAFKKNSSDADTVPITIEKITGSGSSWKFEFKNSDLKEFNWVKIISTSSLKDMANNKAAANNQLVEIEKSGGNIPSWSVGYIEDTSGDGYGDKITYTITEGNGDDPINFSNIEDLKFKFSTMTTEAIISTDSITPNKSLATTTISFKVSPTLTNNYTGIDDGEAKVTLIQNGEQVIFNEAIEDRIGPAITLAEFVVAENSDPCTLKVTLSEAIEDISDINTAWFEIDGTPLKAQAILKDGSNGKKWFFILNKNDITEGQKINLISNSGMIDKSKQKNPPLETKSDITFKYLSSAIEIDNVTYFDTKAKGIMDLVQINFKTSVDQQKDIEKMSFKITWLDTDNNPIIMEVPGTSFGKIGDKSANWYVDDIKYNLQKDLTVLGDNYGQVSFTQVDPSDTTKTVTIDYDNTIAIDMMAPVVTNADYFMFKNGDDTLIVTFSEEIAKNASSNTPFNINNGTKDLEAVHLGTFTSSNTIDYIKIGGDTPATGDSLNINSTAGITGSNIQDNLNNKHVKINIYSEIEILDIAYHENDDYNDGLIDKIIVKTDINVPDDIISDLANLITLNNAREFEDLNNGDIQKLDNGEIGFSISVKQNENIDKNTAITIEDSLSITDKANADKYFIQSNTYPISDSLAPVIKVAIVKPVEIDESNFEDLPQDTLFVTFTENVNFNDMDLNPFNFKNSKDEVINIDLEKDKNIKGFLIDYTSTKLSSGDSIRIDKSGEISDQLGYNEQVSSNIYVPIQVDQVEIHWRDGVFPNPLYKKLTEEDKRVLTEELNIPEGEIKDRSQTIVVAPYGLPPEEGQVSISIKIFDNLGHILADEEMSTNGKIWYYVWDCKNIKKRNVGSGIYMATIKITPESMGTVDNVIKLGIQN